MQAEVDAEAKCVAEQAEVPNDALPFGDIFEANHYHRAKHSKDNPKNLSHCVVACLVESLGPNRRLKSRGHGNQSSKDGNRRLKDRGNISTRLLEANGEQKLVAIDSGDPQGEKIE